MVQVLEANPIRTPLQSLAIGLGAGAPSGIAEMIAKRSEQKKEFEEGQALQRLGIDPKVRDPNLRGKLLDRQTQKESFKEASDIFDRGQGDISQRRQQLEKLRLSTNPEVRKIATEELKKMDAPPVGGVTAQPVPKEHADNISQIIRDNPDASSEELQLEMINAGIPAIHYNQLIESRRRGEEQKGRAAISKEESIRKEVLPIKQEYAKKANAAREGIRNKKELMRLIDTGELNDPTYAAIASNIPLDLGQRLLSPETVEYRAGLVEEFKDLKNIFQGQTRTAELDILQKKLADIYLTDEQKKRVLKSRVNALQSDVIKADAAAEIEEKFPNLGLFQFQKKVEELASEKMGPLFDSIMDEHKAIFDQAERRKSIPLNPEDPDDKEILMQLLKEVNGDKNKARKLAKEKGYKF